MTARDFDAKLPAGFEALEPHVAAWALPTEQARYAKRISTPRGEVRAFYDAIFPHMNAVMTHLSAHPADDTSGLPADTRRLFWLALSYFEAAHPIELNWSGVEPVDAFPAHRIVYQAASQVED